MPGEDEDSSAALAKSLTRRGIEIFTSSKTGKVTKSATGVKVEVETPQGPKTFEADVMLVSIGVLGNVEGVFADSLGVELFKGTSRPIPRTATRPTSRASTPLAT